MAKIHIDGKTYDVAEGRNLLEACLSSGLNVPYFCWHPALDSLGACRQCAVKVFKDKDDTHGKIVMACMTAATDGTSLSITDSEVKAFHAQITEWLMVNHPHDCPVCDEGGECHLQDMTVMTGHTYRRYRFKKRTYRNQNLGPFINHEMNRCIQCYRCTRFYRDYAGGRDFNVFGAHDHLYFGRHQDGALENEFSGNLVEVCPTGVFTDKTEKRHYTRKWDLTTAPSVCVHCAVGCNTLPGERGGELRRVRNRFNSAVNGYFLCDRGRYGYEFVNSPERIRRPLRRVANGPFEAVAKTTALRDLRLLLSSKGRAVGIGSPRATLEANYALRRLVGPERFFAGLTESDARLHASIVGALRQSAARSPSLAEIGTADAVLVLGEDLTNTAPMVALALRQASRQRAIKRAQELKIEPWHDVAVRDAGAGLLSPFFIATPFATKLDSLAIRAVRMAPDDLARLGFAVAHAICPTSEQFPAVPAATKELQELAEQIAVNLKDASRPLVVSGQSCRNQALIEAAASVASALDVLGKKAALSCVLPESNSMGLALLGAGNLTDASRLLEMSAADLVIILENDLYQREDAADVDAFLSKAKHVVVIDHIAHGTSAKADYVLPAATFAEGTGTLVNCEGRAQRSYRMIAPKDEIQESWKWLDELAGAARAPDSPTEGTRLTFEMVVKDMIRDMPVLAGVERLTPEATGPIPEQRVPREPHRFSGRTAITADQNVREQPVPKDQDAPLTFSMEGVPIDGRPGVLPPALLPFYWSPGWNSVQALNKFQSEVGGPLVGEMPGQRLIEPAGENARFPSAQRNNLMPPSFAPRTDEWLLLPFFSIFGSEELSRLAPAVAERSPAPFLALNANDGARLGISEGGLAQITFAQDTLTLPVTLKLALAQGLAALSILAPGVVASKLPLWATISKRGEAP